ncbi:MAG: cadherin-like beta sandwich domain-containing protein, partial [Rhodoluna sp.]
MRNFNKNKGTMKMTTKKLLTVLTAMLLAVLPIHGVSAANAMPPVDTSLATFTVEGTDVEDGDIIIVPNGTVSVAVVAVPNDPDATVNISGDTGLATLDNDLVVEVTGSDGLTKQTYTVNVFVSEKAPGFSNDATLGSLKVNGTTINPGDIVEVAPLTTAVTVEVTTSDVHATSEIIGARDLVTGLNTASVTITAEDGVTTRTYTFKVRVLPLSSNVSLETFTVNGQAVRNGSRLFLNPGTDSVAVVATPADLSSSVSIIGATSLVAGENDLNVTVTSASGTSAVYNVKLIVQVPSSISTLVVFKVSGARVVDGSRVLLPAGTTAVAVIATPSDSSASVEVTGNSDLQIGDNTLSVVVTAEDGSTTSYSVTLKVLQDDDVSLSLFQYDGGDVEDGDSFDLEYGTTSVEVTAEATSGTSTVEILGEDALLTGRNVVRINVTAQDGSVRTYRLFFNVAANTDTTLESLTVAGQDATGGEVTVPAGTRAVVV